MHHYIENSFAQINYPQMYSNNTTPDEGILYLGREFVNVSVLQSSILSFAQLYKEFIPKGRTGNPSPSKALAESTKAVLKSKARRILEHFKNLPTDNFLNFRNNVLQSYNAMVNQLGIQRKISIKKLFDDARVDMENEMCIVREANNFPMYQQVQGIEQVLQLMQANAQKRPLNDENSVIIPQKRQCLDQFNLEKNDSDKPMNYQSVFQEIINKEIENIAPNEQQSNDNKMVIQSDILYPEVIMSTKKELVDKNENKNCLENGTDENVSHIPGVQNVAEKFVDDVEFVVDLTEEDEDILIAEQKFVS